MRIFFLFFTFSVALLAKITIAVTIAPEAFILQNITQGKANIITLIPKNKSPHHYEPKISTMQKLSKAKLYFTIGVEFEKEWQARFQSQNPTLKIIPCDKNITKINNNPHIWLSPKNIIQIARCMSNTLSSIDKNNSIFYQQNLKNFIQKVNNYDKKIQSILALLKQRNFLDIHPAWSYFAAYYHLKEYTIEVEGKNPLIKDLIKLIRFAKEKQIKTIFIQPEFSAKSAQIIANEVGAKVIAISPLKENILDNLLYFAKALSTSNEK